MFQGTYTAMITPFRNGEVDVDQLAANVEYQIEQQVDGLVPVGTTGESPTLSHEEHRRVIECVVETAAKRVTVIAGTGSNSTREALELTEHARQIGADAALMVNPYYNKPTQEGLYRHFMAVAEGVELPIVMYNIPGRTGITMAPETVGRLAQHPRIIGIKEATGSIDIASQIMCSCDPDQLTILSGDDSLTLPLMSIGARGVVSVLSNLTPDRVKALTTAALAGDMPKARQLHTKLFPLCTAMFLETNPIPIKTAMAITGRDSGELRLPLCPMSRQNQNKLEQTLRRHGVI